MRLIAKGGKKLVLLRSEATSVCYCVLRQQVCVTPK